VLYFKTEKAAGKTMAQLFKNALQEKKKKINTANV
jgi:hypothetical protein